MFVKLSAFYRNATNGKYQAKAMSVNISGYSEAAQPKLKYLGQLDLDLSIYVGLQYQRQRFVLQKSMPNAYIDIEFIISPYVEGQPLSDYLPPGTIQNKTS